MPIQLPRSLGAALGLPTPYTGLFPFLDLMRAAGPWLTSTAQQWDTGEADLLALDAQGWVQSLPGPDSGVGFDRVTTAISLLNPGLFRPGRYVVLYEGEGTLAYQGSGVIHDTLRSEPGRDVLTIGPDLAGDFVLRILQTDPGGTGDYLRNIRIYHEDDLPLVEAGEIFNPAFLQRIDDFQALRLEGWLSPSDGDWSSTAPPTIGPGDGPPPDLRTVTADGMPLDLVIALANRVGIDPWIVVPVTADDAWLRAAATQVRDTLAPGLKAYFELPQSVFTGGTAAFHHALSQAQTRWGPYQHDVVAQWYAVRTAELGRIVDEVFAAAPERGLTVLSVPTGRAADLDFLLAPPVLNGENIAGWVDVLAANALIGTDLGRTENLAVVRSWLSDADGGVARALAHLRNGGLPVDTASLALGQQQLIDHVARAGANGLLPVVRQGGPDLRMLGGVRDDGLLALFNALRASPELASLYGELLAGWQAAGGGLFLQGDLIGPSDMDTQGGVLDSVWQQDGTLYDALVAASADPPWWLPQGDSALAARLSVLAGTAAADSLTGAAGPDIINAGTGDDVLVGLEDDDVLAAGAGNDRLDGGADDDRMSGGDGADTLTGGAGDDYLNGGPGTDRAVYGGNRADYELVVSLTPGPGGVIMAEVIHRHDGADGHDRLYRVEELAFADGVVALAVPTITVTDLVVRETAGTQQLLVPVTLSAPVDGPVRLDYATRQGLAREGRDFTPVSGTLVLPAGTTQGVIAIPISGDTLPEMDKDFILVLRNADGAVLAGDGDGLGARITIQDDDGDRHTNPDWTPSLGMNLDFVADWLTSQPFLDIMKQSRIWVTQTLDWVHTGWTTDEFHLLDLDRHGWVRSLPGDGDEARYRAVATVNLTEMASPDHFRTGRHVVLYDGEGTLEYGMQTTLVPEESVPGRHVVDIAYGQGHTGFYMRIVETDPEGTGDYIRNIRVYREEDLALVEAGALFNPAYIERLSDFRTLRFIQWMRSQDITPEMGQWQTRATPAEVNYSWQGVPAEILVALANQVGADPWFTLPYNADDDFIRNFVTLVHDQLDPGLVAHFEFSNEVWNWQFPQSHHAAAQAEARWGSDSAGQAGWLQWYGMRSARMAQIVDEVYGPAGDDRALTVIATQTGYLGLEDALLTTPLWVAEGNEPAWRHMEAYAITAYVHFAVDGDFVADYFLDWIQDADGGYARAMANLMQVSLPRVLAQLDYHKAVADRYGLDLVMYEGGQHLDPIGLLGGRHDHPYAQQVTAFIAELNRHPLMAQLYDAIFEHWYSIGGKTIALYSDISRAGFYGSFGALEYLSQPTSVKWETITGFNEANAAWWEARDPAVFTTDRFVNGTAGADSLSGGDGDDVLIGGAGADTLTGGPGADRFRGTLAGLDGDTIADFSPAADAILLTGWPADALAVRFDAAMGMLLIDSGTTTARLTLPDLGPATRLPRLIPHPDGVEIRLDGSVLSLAAAVVDGVEGTGAAAAPFTVMVTRSGGGLGEPWTPAVGRRSRTAGISGKRDATWASGPIPSMSTSMEGTAAPSGAQRASSSAY